MSKEYKIPEKVLKARKKEGLTDKQLDKGVNFVKGALKVSIFAFVGLIGYSFMTNRSPAHQPEVGIDAIYGEANKGNDAPNTDLYIDLLGYEESSLEEFEEDIELLEIEADKESTEWVEEGVITEEITLSDAGSEEQYLYHEETGELVEESPDNAVNAWYKDALSGMSESLENVDLEGMKEKGTDLLITTVDFLFYNEPITDFNITVSMISEQAKNDLLTYATLADGLISEYDPDYKETLSEKYQNGMNSLNNVKENVKEAIINRVGEDTYNKTMESFDSVKEVGKSALDYGKSALGKAKEFVKSHYESFRSNHEK